MVERGIQVDLSTIARWVVACNLRVFRVIGDRDDPDYAVGPTIALSDVLNKHGIPYQFYHYQEFGHEYPRDFAQLLGKMLIWISEKNA